MAAMELRSRILDAARRASLVSLLAAMAALFAACGDGDDDGPANPLAGATWSLTALGAAQSPAAVLDGAEVTATFSDDGGVSGRGGCNSYSGTHSVEGATFAIDDLSYTERACADPEGVLTQETRFFDILAASKSYEIQGGELTLATNDGQALIFARAEE